MNSQQVNPMMSAFPFVTQLQIALYHKASARPNHIRPNLPSTRAAKRASYTRQERKKNFGLYSHGITHHFERQVFEERRAVYQAHHNLSHLIKATTIVKRATKGVPTYA